MTGTLIGAVFVLFFVGGVGLPGVVWLDRRRRTPIGGPAVASDEPTARGLIDLLEPFFDAAQWLARPDPIDPTAAPIASRIAPVVSLFAALAAFALIPFGGRYAILDEPTSLVVADPVWGSLGVVVAAAAAGFGTTLVGIAGSRTESHYGGLRAAAQGTAGVLALTASLLPMWVLYETMQPSAIGAWQDGVIALAPTLGKLGLPWPAWWPEGLGLPAWGILLDPVAFFLCVTASMVVAGGPPFDAATSPVDLDGGVLAELSGFRRLVVGVAGHVWTLALAALLTLVFLGGWSVPWLPQATIVGAIAPSFGTGFAELLCALVHVACFVGKLALMVSALLLARGSFPRLRDDQVMALCFRWLVPLGLFAAWLTVAVAGMLGGDPA